MNRFIVTDSVYTQKPLIDKSFDEAQILNASLEFFDREGYELAKLEELLHLNSGIVLSRLLNHTSAGQPWIYGPQSGEIKLDHSAIFTRYAYANELRDQLLSLRHKRPELNKLLVIKPKYGIDVSIDFIDTELFIELFHVEKDFLDRDQAIEAKTQIEDIVQKTDWHAFAKYLVTHRAEWSHLCSDDESDYKVRLLGVNRAFENIKVYHGDL